MVRMLKVCFARILFACKFAASVLSSQASTAPRGLGVLNRPNRHDSPSLTSHLTSLGGSVGWGLPVTCRRHRRSLNSEVVGCGGRDGGGDAFGLHGRQEPMVSWLDEDDCLDSAADSRAA
jgi:hypothetical protein